MVPAEVAKNPAASLKLAPPRIGQVIAVCFSVCGGQAP
jgi:hypothetical protein